MEHVLPRCTSMSGKTPSVQIGMSKGGFGDPKVGFGDPLTLSRMWEALCGGEDWEMAGEKLAD